MGRRLPWKTSGDAAAGPSPHRTPKAESPAPVKAAPARSPHFTPTPRRQRASEPRFHSPRSPSTSPPPEVPQEEFMLSGPLDDDRYRMVEDEFLHTAQRFTTHLHRAEYNRLKARAESQNAAAIRAIARPVVGPLTTIARIRREGARRGAKQRAVLRSAGGGGGGGDGGGGAGDLEPWVGTSLQSLMEHHQSDTRSISSYAPTHSTTRASAGYMPTGGPSCPHDARSSRQRGGNVSTAPRTPAPSRIPASATPSTTHRHQVQHSTPRTSQDPISLTTSRGATGNQTPSRSGSVRDVPRDSGVQDRRHARADHEHSNGHEDDDDDPFGISRRKVRREQSRKSPDKDPPRKLSPDTIPSFL